MLALVAKQLMMANAAARFAGGREIDEETHENALTALAETKGMRNKLTYRAVNIAGSTAIKTTKPTIDIGSGYM